MPQDFRGVTTTFKGKNEICVLNNLCLPVPYYRQDPDPYLSRPLYKIVHLFDLSLMCDSGLHPGTVEMI